MRDAGSETKRELEPDRPNFVKTEHLATSLGSYEARVHAALAEASSARVIERIWNKDASLWKSEESHQKIISNSLGWLTVAGEMLAVVNELKSFADTVRASGKSQHAMVCGMGGS